ncbi:MAG TPA: T9SS type A sorting domain-containing protein, partial [Phnomibacter sp.]|nr:T9SS type A sorting domain-containing protein [Phnomibacter sp.]
VGVPNPINGGSTATGATNSVRHTAISFTSNWNPMIAYFNTGSNNRATTAIYNKATESWSLSAILSSRDAPAISLVRDAKANVYCSFADAVTNGSGRTLARVFMLPAGSNSWGELRNTETTAGVDEPAGNLSLSAGFAQPNPFIIYTKANSAGVVTPIVQAFVTQQTEEEAPGPITAPKQMEKLNRGLIAIRTSPNQVYVGWRLLGTDTSIMQFNVYANGIKVNTTAVATSTNFVHQTTENVAYTIRPVVNGEELDASEPTTVWMQPYLEINLQKPENGTTPDGESYSYTPNDCSIGDVDGDGQYEIFVKWEPTNAKDNSQSGYTGNVYIDCYRLNGTRLWRIDLGRNIRAGAHYTQFMVYDFDGDGKAEMACKTADGTKDGAGTVIGDALADHRNNNGYILTGPEFLTMFNGLTGAAMATVDYLPARGSVSSWGDNYGNRVDRFVAAVAYLDGVRPSLIMGRGYYTRLVRVAWDWRNGQFTRRWTFDSNQPGNGNHVGQGNHQMSVGDMDGDGRQEITNGSSTQNHNGAALWANGLGHGDALHLTDINPESPGLEMWCPYETPAGNGQIGAALLNAKTGTPIFTVPVASDDVGRALAADIDPRHKGLELWAARGDLYTATGVSLGSTKPSMNFAIWWDADTTRELLDGINITKWNWNSNTNPIIFTATGCASNNGTKATPNLSADLLGDWREEVIFRTADNEKLRIYTTTALTDSKFYTVMHDPQYRVAIAWQNSGYNQPPHPGFYLGTGMAPQPPANLYLSGSNPLPLQWLQFTAVHQGKNVLLHWNTQAEQNTHHFAVERSANARQFATIGTVAAAGRAAINQYQYIDDQPLAGISWYRIRQVDKDGKFTYSPTKAVLAENKHQGAQLYPNPLRKGNPIYYNGNANQTTKVNATVINAQGVILTTIKGNTHQINADLTSFMARQVPGIYFVKLMQGNEVSTVTLNLY